MKYIFASIVVMSLILSWMYAFQVDKRNDEINRKYGAYVNSMRLHNIDPLPLKEWLK